MTFSLSIKVHLICKYRTKYCLLNIHVLGDGNLIENLEILQDNTLQHTTLVEILPKKVGQQWICC